MRATTIALAFALTSRATEPQPTPQPTAAEVMTSRGYVRHRGDWRTPQEIEIIERNERAMLAEKQWTARLRRLRRQVDDPSVSSTAAEEIRETVDPHAVPALVAAMAGEPAMVVRECYLEALSRIGSADAVRALVSTAIDHADAETRLVAAEQIAARHAGRVAPMVVGFLRDADNARVNRAAELLGRLGDPSVVAALVEALETRHTVVTSDGTPDGSTTATFTPAGGGLSIGGNRQTRILAVRNAAVHAALVTLAGVDFQWDAIAWRAWLANRDAPEGFDLRRGELR